MMQGFVKIDSHSKSSTFFVTTCVLTVGQNFVSQFSQAKQALTETCSPGNGPVFDLAGYFYSTSTTTSRS